MCTEYPVTSAFEMVHATCPEMLKDYAPEHISFLGTSSGGNLALGMVPYIQMIVVQGMFHCYPIFPVCREAREGWEMMVLKMKPDDPGHVSQILEV